MEKIRKKSDLFIFRGFLIILIFPSEKCFITLYMTGAANIKAAPKIDKPGHATINGANYFSCVF